MPPYREMLFRKQRFARGWTVVTRKHTANVYANVRIDHWTKEYSRRDQFMLPAVGCSFLTGTSSAVYAISFLCTFNTRKIVRGRGTDRDSASSGVAHVQGQFILHDRCQCSWRASSSILSGPSTVALTIAIANQSEHIFIPFLPFRLKIIGY
ncbi:hypothetical protein FPV67DRAFT_1480605 [Lyophyllum atratum]|nr:hypothetical protein FPV67DRAFT_1480605 [Lyophyllum atratum]